jgi:hypothetical protein
MQEEQDIGLRLMQSLDAKQQSVATIAMEFHGAFVGAFRLRVAL